MSIVKSSFSAFGKLLTVGVLSAAFLFGMIGVVYMSLQGDEITVPEIVGKDFLASEEELAKLGLKIKRRADRVSSEQINTVLEQLPKAGDTVKTGQMILVVVAKHNPDGSVPDTIKKGDEQEDIEKIEELISDKPKKSSSNNDNSAKKKTSKTRDVVVSKTDDKTDADKADAKSNETDGKPSNGDEKKPGTTSGDKSTTPKPVDKPGDGKPDNSKPGNKVVKPTPNAGAVTRPRKTP
jgi:beta-lactam-binding protein with PASTA domain